MSWCSILNGLVYEFMAMAVEHLSFSKNEEIRFLVMRTVEDHPYVTQRELSTKLGVSVGRINYCLKALGEKGWIKIENFRTSEAKWRYMYVLTPAGLIQKTSMTGKFIERKLQEYKLLQEEIKALGLTDLDLEQIAGQDAPQISKI
jgi:EPS-associated MarR family transcriptional regulator